MMKEIILTVERQVKERLWQEGSGHDWHHIDRVRNLAILLAKEEGADKEIAELAALLHDLPDEKMSRERSLSLSEIALWLKELNVTEQANDHVCRILSTISFKGTGASVPVTLEGRIVQDADRLDAIGAIGTARAFLYAGSKGHSLHAEESVPRENMTKEEYRLQPSTAINHFYEKLLKLKSLMNTDAAKVMAEERHAFMLSFLDQFYKEWKEAGNITHKE